jgi:hypothetical protein
MSYVTHTCLYGIVTAVSCSFSIPAFRTHRQQGDLISLILFFQNKESRLRREDNIKMGLTGIAYEAPDWIHMAVIDPAGCKHENEFRKRRGIS